MAPPDILIYPNPKLRKKSVSVKKIDGKLRLLLDGMLETMRNAEGIGLSAPQVGRNIRVIIVCDAREADEKMPDEKGELPVIEMINPVMGKSSGSALAPEGCLSVPDFVAKVRRKETVEVEWLNRSGEKKQMLAQGLTARIIQHEIDHLDGVLFVDRLTGLKKEMMLKKMDRTFREPEGGTLPPRSRRENENLRRGK